MNFVKLILEDLSTQREGVLSQGFWALLVYRISHQRLSIKNRLIRAIWYFINVVMQKIVEVLTGICLPESTKVGRRLCIEHFGAIVVHGGVVIGDDCLIRQGVTIGNKGYADPSGAPVIGNRVEIGAGAKIIGRVFIGDDVIIGANAVVVKDIPSHSIAVGIPAKVITKKV